jgi:hypothetical protein
MDRYSDWYKVGKGAKGEAVQEIEKRRMLKLKELVVKLGRKCKLWCPEGEQEWEYWGERLDENISQEFAALSRGIRMLPHQAIQNSQIFTAMRAHVDAASEFHLPSAIYFRRDPIQELYKISQQKIFVTAHGLPPTLLEMGSDSKKETYKHSDQLRRKNIASNRTYAEQFLLEQRAFVNAFVDFARSFRSRLPSGNIEPLGVLGRSGI